MQVEGAADAEAGAIRAMYHAIVAAIAAMESEASVPYVGVILGIAAAAAIMAAAMGLMGGFAEGGYTGTGPTHQVAGVVHRGEYVIPAARVNTSTMPLLQAIHSGALADIAAPRPGSTHMPRPAGARSSAGHSAQPYRISNYIYSDRSKMARGIERDDAHEKWVGDVAARTFAKLKT